MDVCLPDKHYQELDTISEELTVYVVALGDGLAGLASREPENLKIFGKVFKRTPHFPDLWLDHRNVVAVVCLDKVGRIKCLVCETFGDFNAFLGRKSASASAWGGGQRSPPTKPPPSHRGRCSITAIDLLFVVDSHLRHSNDTCYSSNSESLCDCNNTVLFLKFVDRLRIRR